MKRLLQAPSQRALAGWQSLERPLDALFGSEQNPLRQLGALAFLSFWVLAVSGIWLYAAFDTSVTGAHASVAELSAATWSPGWLMRSAHRYATDMFVLFTAAHLLRELLHGRWRRFRRFSWLTGSALLPLVAVSAVGGFWLSWDRLAQFSAVATAEWLDALPLLAQPLARNFLGVEAVGDRLFSLLVFVHLGVPLLLVFALWFHVQRLTRASVFPPTGLALGTLAMLVTLSVVLPVTGDAPADLARVPVPLSLDWIVLFVHPLMYATSPTVTWVAVLAVLGALLALPLVPSRACGAATHTAVAVVDPQNCNGCRRCFADCPFAAVTMVKHPDGRPGRELASVDAALCAGCGICVGSCPSSTPFRSLAELVTGIDMPDYGIGSLRSELRRGLQGLEAPDPVVVFGCEQGADVTELSSADVLALPLICTGQLPPSFIEYALHDGAAGVVVASCPTGGCAYRLGALWTAQRLDGARAPYLRTAVPRSAVIRVEAATGETPRVAGALAVLRERLAVARADPPLDAGVRHGR